MWQRWKLAMRRVSLRIIVRRGDGMASKLAAALEDMAGMLETYFEALVAERF